MLIKTSLLQKFFKVLSKRLKILWPDAPYNVLSFEPELNYEKKSRKNSHLIGSSWTEWLSDWSEGHSDNPNSRKC